MRTALLKTLANVTASKADYEVVHIEKDMITVLDNKEGMEYEAVLEDDIKLELGDQIDGKLEWVDEDLQGLSEVKLVSRDG